MVFENQRYTFGQIFERSLKAAAMFRDVYRIRKGRMIERSNASTSFF